MASPALRNRRRMGSFATREPDQLGHPGRGSGVEEEGEVIAMRIVGILSLLLLLFPLVGTLTADSVSIPRSFDSEYPAGVGWWGTWDGALTEAKRTGKPILLLSAAPQCHGVPGIW